MYRVRQRLGRSSRLGAIALLALSSILVILSYRYPNIIVEIDSVVAFAAAIVLIYKDTTRSVQLRVVERVLESARELTRELISRVEGGEISRMHFAYVQTGSRIRDVVLVPRLFDESERSNTNNPSLSLSEHKKDEGTTQRLQIPTGVMQNKVDASASLIKKKGLVPPGRSLAELFAREMALENPKIDDIITRAPLILTEAFALSSATSLIKRTEELIELYMLHPLLKNDCFQSRSENSRIDLGLECLICSMFAVLICYTTGRDVKVKSCKYDQETDSATIEFQILEKK